jgi:Domain of Unknown Function (DUF1259)
MAMTHATFRWSALAGVALLTVVGAPALAQQGAHQVQQGDAPAQQQVLTPNADWHRTVDDTLGKPGTEQPSGVGRVSLPRTDLKVMLDSVQIRPGLALGSWLAFQQHGQDLTIIGNLVLLESEVAPVMRRLAEGGIEVKPVHNHMLGDEPRVFLMHFWGVGNPEKLGRGLRVAFERTNSRSAG